MSSPLPNQPVLASPVLSAEFFFQWEMATSSPLSNQPALVSPGLSDEVFLM